MTPRLYLAPDLATGEERTLDAERAHYLLRVLRLKSDDALRCFDGSGTEFEARVASADPRRASVTVGAQARREAPSTELHLALGWLKGQAMDNAVQKATELGITDFWPVRAARSNVKVDDKRANARLAHWQKIAQSAAEQSERLFVPKIHPPTDLRNFLVEMQAVPVILLALGSATLPAEIARGPLALAVGPEGGWTEQEVALADAARANVYSLGKGVLRAETVPLAALSAIRQSWRWEQ